MLIDLYKGFANRYTSFAAISSSKISRTVKGTITRPDRWKLGIARSMGVSEHLVGILLFRVQSRLDASADIATPNL